MPPQLQSLGWGVGEDAEASEMLALARCDGIPDLTKSGAQEVFELNQKYAAISSDTLSLCNLQLMRTKEEIGMLRTRLCHVRKRISALDPALKLFPFVIRTNEEMRLAGLDTACPGFLRDNSIQKFPGPYELELLDLNAMEEELDEEEMEPEPIKLWVDQKVASMIRYGKELDFDDEEESDSDEDDTNLLATILAVYETAAREKPAYKSEEYEQKRRLQELEKERRALTSLILNRESTFHSFKKLMNQAEGLEGSLRMDRSYLYRMNQLQTRLQMAGRQMPDLVGDDGPQVFHKKLSENEKPGGALSLHHG